MDDKNYPFLMWRLFTSILAGQRIEPNAHGYAKRYDPAGGSGNNAEMSGAEKKRIRSWDKQHGGF